MSISLENIYNNLQDYKKEIILSDKSGMEINDIFFLKTNALLKNHKQKFKDTFLYIIKASDIIEANPEKFPNNILCLLDANINIKPHFPKTSNIILINSVSDISNLLNIIEKQIADNNKVIRSSTILLELATKNDGIQFIVNNCFDIFCNPIIVFDRSLKILAYSKIKINEPLWNDIIKKRHGLYNIVIEFNKAQKLDMCIKTNMENSKYQHMTSGIISHGNIAGYISIFDCLKPFEDVDKELLNQLSKIIASEMEKDIHYSQTKELMFEYFIQDLIEERIKNEIIVQEKIKYMGLNLKKYLFLLKIGFKPGNTDDNNLWYIKETLESTIGIGNSLIYKNSILCIISRDEASTLNDKKIQVLYGFLKDNKMIAGLSRYFSNMIHIKDYYEQCTKAMEIGFPLDENENLFRYDDYSVYHIIEMLNTSVNIKSICHPALTELIEYDKNNNTEYCKTLYIYLSNNSNLTKSAKHLLLHRNTMEYRIHKIEEILKMNIYDSNNSIILFLSLNIIKYNIKQGSIKLGYVF